MPVAAQTIAVSQPVVVGTDDAEEDISGPGSTPGLMRVTTGSSTTSLQLGTNGNIVQYTGIRFAGVTIPKGANVTNAYIQFTPFANDGQAVSLQIKGEAVPNATTFSTTAFNISNRLPNVTTATVNWTFAGTPSDTWATVPVTGTASTAELHRTPNLSTLVEEVIAVDGWETGNSLSFIISLVSGQRRTARSFDHNPAHAPVLVIQYDNEAPTVDAGTDATVNLATGATLAGTAIDDGAPFTSTLTTTWSQISGPGTATFGDASDLNSTVSFDVGGNYVLQLEADDGLASSTDTVTISVNEAPVVDAGADQPLSFPTDNTADLDSSTTDDGIPGALTFTWSKLSGPGDVTFGNANAEDTTATFTQGGVYTLQLEANDGLAVGSDTIVINVNDTPVVNVGADQAIALPAGATIDATVTDEGLLGPLTFAWSKVSGPGDVTFTPADAEDTVATFSQGGTYVLQLTANDGELEGIDTVTVAANQAPDVDAGANQALGLPGVGMPADVSLNGTVTDDGLVAAFVVTWTQVSGPGVVLFADAHAVDTPATIPDEGEFVLRLSANDGELESSDSVTITASATNQAPQVNAGADQATTFPTANITGTLIDDGLPVAATTTWSKLSGPGDVTFGDANALLTTATFSQGGTYVLRLTAADGEFTVTDDITIAVNQAPNVDAGPNQTVGLPGAGASSDVSLDGTVTDDGLLGAFTVQWTQESGPGTVVFASASAVDTQATIPVEGEYVLRLTANDGELEASDTVTISASTTNREPAVDAGADQQITLPDNASLAGVVTDDGLPNGNVTTTWSKVSGPGTVIFADASAVDTTASFSEPGIYVLQLTATDGALSDSDEVTITVNEDTPPVSDAPVVNAGEDQSITLPAGANLDATVTDDGLPEALTTTWSKVSGPGDVTFGNASSVDTPATFSAPGTYVLRLTATDGEHTVSDEVSIAVNAATGENTAPVVNAGADATIIITGSASLNGTLTDDGLPAAATTTWSKVSGPGDVTFANANALNTTATFSAIGDYVLRLTANDGELSDSDEVTITVLDTTAPTSQAPVVNAGEDQSITLPASASLNATVTDDGLPEALTTTWSKQSGPGTVTFGDANSVDTTVSFSEPGTYVLRLTVTDGEHTVAAEVTITVEAAPENPSSVLLPGIRK